MDRLIEVKSLTKRDKAGRSILSNVSFVVNEGEHVAILGPQGAGKTTLAQIICGFEKADQGEVVLRMDDWMALPEQRRAAVRNTWMGYLPSYVHIVDALTLEQNMELSYELCHGRRSGKKRRNEKIGHILEVLRLTTYRHYRNASLDPLKRCQAGLAVQLVRDPEILVIDDSFMYLGLRESEVLRPMMEQLTQSMSILFLGSSEPEWMDCDRICRINHGVIQEDAYENHKKSDSICI